MKNQKLNKKKEGEKKKNEENKWQTKHIRWQNLFDSEINLLLSLEKKKIKEIETGKSSILRIQNSFPVLEQELIEIKNKIKKLGEINAWQ